MLKLNTKCWISAFNARGSRWIIVAVQVGAVKMYVAVVEPLRKKERHDSLRNYQNWWFSGVPTPPPLMLMYFFAGFFWISPHVWPNSRYCCCLFLTLWISLNRALYTSENIWLQMLLLCLWGALFKYYMNQLR
jgi:hypothetical protein